MLAGLTGLLLTLGGDQTAVVFDPPLDPEIFNWDGRTLSMKPEALPRYVGFDGPPTPPYEDFQRILIHEPVSIRGTPSGIFDGSIGTDLNNNMSVYSSSGNCYQLTLDGSALYAGQIFFLCAISASSPIPIIEFLPDESAEISALQARVKALEQALESCQCASDLDGDGSVGFTDLVELISDWGPCSA